MLYPYVCYAVLYVSVRIVCVQVITSIPTQHLPKMLQWGAGPPPSISAAAASMGVGMAGGFADAGSGRGQILWVRGLTRLQTQVRSRVVSIGH